MATKAKTNKAAKKRFRITKNGKVIHRSQGDNSHLKAGKSSAQKARRKQLKQLSSKTQARKLRSLINA